VKQRFSQGVVMLHAREYEHAATSFHRVLELAPDLPEAHVNMGFALIGLERFAAARDFFESALALKRDQANAYYGLAVALEGLSDAPGAIGAMRTYLHLTRADDPYGRKAQAALWEWEAARGDGAQEAGARPSGREGADAAAR
jgi:tetratricopeptide (TPR) repeat protein